MKNRTNLSRIESAEMLPSVVALEINKKNKVKRKALCGAMASIMLFGIGGPNQALSELSATHIYHNHMPNFWPYYDVSTYASLPVGAPIRYTYDGQVIELKNNPPSNYTFYIPDSGAPMPHDDLVSYYTHHAKTGAYLYWPMDTAKSNRVSHPLSQTHVTMSASVINNVQSFAEIGNITEYYLGWGNYWREVHNNTLTQNGYKALDTIHFSGHHSMGPLVGNEYFLKDLIYQNVTLAQDYFLGDSFKSSKGFFPTELGFSERIIPVLTKLGIEWSVLGNVHYSRTLRDYPYLNNPGVDTLVSPPNRADMQNSSDIGSWVSLQMFNEQQVTQNKFPFASIPHYVQYVDPETGQQHKIAGIPVEQASSWEEGYQGSVTAGVLREFSDEAASLGRQQYFVIAHDGDNSSGRAGDGGTWLNSGYVTYSEADVVGMGVDEYLRAYPIPEDDIVHVQDGSWIDTRDSSADPTWYHWHLPMGVWAGQMADFNAANGTNFTADRQHMVSLELGYHYLERNFALLQAGLNYAKTAEQIWLDDNPNYWQPTSNMDREVTYEGNQLNPWMLSYPVKGDEANNYTGGANPAELSWYFLIASIDSGFGYYDENVDDGVKPTISFNQSLHFSTPYVEANLSKDRTGPSIWWPQRYPYNPGSVNNGKAEGWATVYADTNFAIYTYAYDVSGIASAELKVRVHTNKWAEAKDKTFKLYDPKAHAQDPDVNPNNVGEWQSVNMKVRDLTPDINGVEWQPSGKAMFDVVPAEKIGALYYQYLDQYQDQLLDYYIEMTDTNGNVTKSDIQQVYVGAGRYSNVGGQVVEDVDGSIAGEALFFTQDVVPGNLPPVAVISPNSHSVERGSVVTLSAAGSFDDDGTIESYLWSSGETSSDITVTVNERATYSVTVVDNVGARTRAEVTISIVGEEPSITLYYKNNTNWGSVCLHYSVDGASTWTSAPGEPMLLAGNEWYRTDVFLEPGFPLEFVTNNCASEWDNNGGNNYSIDEGVWQLQSGSITAGEPKDLEQNIPPVARISPESQTVLAGTAMTLSAAGSTDVDGTIVGYQWSNGSTTPTINVSVDKTVTYSVNVTDDDGATSTEQVTLTVEKDLSNFDTVYFRGTPNDWDASPMTLVADNLWQAEVLFDGRVEQRFKFDIHGDWSYNFGDSDANGVLEQGGGDIYVDLVGTYLVEMNDADMSFSYSRLDANTRPVSIIYPSATTVEVGEVVVLDGAGSYDSDGSVEQYLWSNGDTHSSTEVIFTSEGEFSQSLIVTDNEGATGEAEVIITVLDSSSYTSNFNQLYFRGTANSWNAAPMNLVADNVWQIRIDLDGQENQRFKFDVNGDWGYNFGDNNADGYLDQTGNDIYTGLAGSYVIQVDDQAMTYTLIDN